jgi:hypothetical protein
MLKEIKKAASRFGKERGRMKIYSEILRGRDA